VPIRPLWELSDEDERRTKQVEVRFRSRADGGVLAQMRTGAVREAETSGGRNSGPILDGRARTIDTTGWPSVSGLLDGSAQVSWFVLILLSMGLGAAHAMQPGHGKTLVTTVALGPGARFYEPAILGLATSLAHVTSVLAIAAVLWSTGSSRVGGIHQGLARCAGFAIAAAGFWRVGRHMGGHGEHETEGIDAQRTGAIGLLGLGLAGGLVPCWDAVGLLVLAAAVGRLAAGVGLVLAFSAGMAAALVGLGYVAWRVKRATIVFDRAPIWQRRLGLLCGSLLAISGLWLFLR
jgi:ABC-type nickel/cobalt efflux system permease component RcnA